MAFLLKSNFVLDESTYHWEIGLRKEIRRRLSPLVILAFDLFLLDFMCWVYSPYNVYILNYFIQLSTFRLIRMNKSSNIWLPSNNVISFYLYIQISINKLLILIYPRDRQNDVICIFDDVRYSGAAFKVEISDSRLLSISLGNGINLFDSPKY